MQTIFIEKKYRNEVNYSNVLLEKREELLYNSRI